MIWSFRRNAVSAYPRPIQTLNERFPSFPKIETETVVRYNYYRIGGCFFENATTVDDEKTNWTVCRDVTITRPPLNRNPTRVNIVNIIFERNR